MEFLVIIVFVFVTYYIGYQRGYERGHDDGRKYAEDNCGAMRLLLRDAAHK